jgi:hypothetical protein
LLVPVLLAGVGIGMVAAGVTASPTIGGQAAAVVILLGALRALRTGVRVDEARDRVVVRTFWRTHHVPLDALVRVDAAGRTEGGTPALRFLLRDGREYASLGFTYLAGAAAERLGAELARAVEGRGVEIALSPRSFRRPA